MEDIKRSNPDDRQLGELSEAVAKALLSRQAVCATAESCTGGLLAKLLTDIAGSSAWFAGGFVCYSNAAKHSMLGVPEALIEAHGAVSREVVLALSEGVIAHTHVDLAVAISGVAGPAGGSPAKPVGTVWIAWARSAASAATAVRAGAATGEPALRPSLARRYMFKGNRDEVRRAAAAEALRGILHSLGNDGRQWSS